MAAPVDLGSTSGLTGASWVHTMTADAPAGTRIFLEVSWFTSTITVASVAGRGLTWVVDKQSATDSGEMIAFISADNPSGVTAGTITVTPSASLAGTSGIIAAHYKDGIVGGASGYLSGTPPAPDTTFAGTAWATPSITPTAGDNVYLLAISANDGTTPESSTATAPATEIHDKHDATATQTLTSAYREVSGATGSYSIAGTWLNAVGENRRGIVAYKAAAAGGGARRPFTALPFL